MIVVEGSADHIRVMTSKEEMETRRAQKSVEGRLVKRRGKPPVQMGRFHVPPQQFHHERLID